MGRERGPGGEVLMSKTAMDGKPRMTALAALLLLAGCGDAMDVRFPDPVLLQVAPDTLDVRQAPPTLVLSGEGFARSSHVRFGDLDFQPEFVSIRELRLTLSREQAIAPAGTVQVRVTTPPPGGGVSAARPVFRNFGAPAVTMISPGHLAVHDTETVLTLTGTGFTPHTTVYVWRGVDEASTEPYFNLRTETTYLSAERVRFRISYWSAYHQGTWHVHAGNPDVGGTGNALPLIVD
jgi:hypothetical protein